uniref:Uncharacterized protein n=1 Tax=Setaria digitata TaxID=48799 RepID=A0A915Q7G1_9BILA
MKETENGAEAQYTLEFGGSVARHKARRNNTLSYEVMRYDRLYDLAKSVHSYFSNEWSVTLDAGAIDALCGSAPGGAFSNLLLLLSFASYALGPEIQHIKFV